MKKENNGEMKVLRIKISEFGYVYKGNKNEKEEEEEV